MAGDNDLNQPLFDLLVEANRAGPNQQRAKNEIARLIEPVVTRAVRRCYYGAGGRAVLELDFEDYRNDAWAATVMKLIKRFRERTRGLRKGDPAEVCGPGLISKMAHDEAISYQRRVQPDAFRADKRLDSETVEPGTLEESVKQDGWETARLAPPPIDVQKFVRLGRLLGFVGRRLDYWLCAVLAAAEVDTESADWMWLKDRAGPIDAPHRRRTIEIACQLLDVSPATVSPELSRMMKYLSERWSRPRLQQLMHIAQNGLDEPELRRLGRQLGFEGERLNCWLGAVEAADEGGLHWTEWIWPRGAVGTQSLLAHRARAAQIVQALFGMTPELASREIGRIEAHLRQHWTKEKLQRLTEVETGCDDNAQ